jgi:hypothetical protein
MVDGLPWDEVLVRQETSVEPVASFNLSGSVARDICPVVIVTVRR